MFLSDLGQGLEPFEAAALAVWLHGRAADRLAGEVGTVGILASEVAAALPATLAALRGADRPERVGVGDAVVFPEPR